MAFSRTPHMPADPVAGFLAGFTSFFSRIFIGAIAIFSAWTLCCICAGAWGWGIVYGWVFASFGMIFLWAAYGLWFILGLAALITMFGSLWSFVNDSDGKHTFFLIFTATVVYFCLVDIPGAHWVFLAIAYALIAAAYWFLPQAIAAMFPEPVEKVEAIPPSAPTDPEA